METLLIIQMIDMLHCESENPEIARIIDKYGPGFEEIYFDGKADGRFDGISYEKEDSVKRGLNAGVDEEIISVMTGFSIDQIEEIRRKL